jgi:hypothetical protein
VVPAERLTNGGSGCVLLSLKLCAPFAE